jgi:hypothetical protein
MLLLSLGHYSVHRPYYLLMCLFTKTLEMITINASIDLQNISNVYSKVLMLTICTLNLSNANWNSHETMILQNKLYKSPILYIPQREGGQEKKSKLLQALVTYAYNPSSSGGSPGK